MRLKHCTSCNDGHRSAWLDGRLYVRLAGAAAAVNAARGMGGVELAPDAAREWWLGIRDQTEHFFVCSAADLADGESLWRLSVPSTTAPIDLPGRQLIEWHGAERWWRTRAPARDVRAAASRAQGHATLMRGADKSCGVFAPLSEVLMRVHRELKRAFDPAGVFNPGRLYREL